MMDVNIEEPTYEDSTPIKNSKGNITENITNSYVLEDTNCTANSSELFSDNENENENDLIYYTPNISKTETSFLNISGTSLLDTNKLFQTSGVEKPAVIPSTPLSLIPFISKINEQWTSDLETPQMDKSFNIKSSERDAQTVYFKESTPNNSNFKNVFDESASTSPVINYTRIRRRTKRRIFNSPSVHVNIDKIALDNQDSENDIVVMDTCDNIEKKNILLESNNAQDFFSNASFASVDQICANFAEKNDTHNVESNNKKRRFEEELENNIIILKENCNEDENKCDEKKILNSDSKIRLSMSMNNIGFSTTNSKHINVSESAISKTKSLLEKDDIPFMGFSTASGKHINVSESAVSKEQSLHEMDDIPVMGFSTASGKNINVSESAISKAKSLLEKDDIPFMGFSTASGKHINVSESAISKTKSLLEKDDIPFMGFSTASGKHVNVSESAVSKAKSLHEMDDIPVMGFSTASGKHINISKSAILKATSLLEKDDIPFMGFSTASGKHINISESAILKTKSLLEKDDIPFMGFSIASGKHINVSESATLETKSLLEKDDIPFMGFSTASGKHINVSESAISKAKSLHEMDDIPAMGFSTACRKHINVSESATSETKSLLEKDDIPFMGFSTASGKHINVSESAISKAKSLLETDDICFMGFSTASGKHINVSESAISKAKSLHEMDNIPSMVFSTASGKHIFVSESAISKAKSLHEMNDIPSMEFSTANGKHINISESAISKAKSLHETDNIPSMGFSTANGKHINVSESAISKAKSLLETDDYISLTNVPLNNESNLDNNYKIKNPSSSFLTSDRSLNISYKTLSTEKKMLCERLEDIQINKNVTNELNKPVVAVGTSENINSNLNKSLLEKSIISRIGFTMAAGCEVNISEEGLKEAEIFLSDDTYDTNQCDNLLNKPLNKRKSLHVCDNSVDKLSSNTKKVRLSNRDITEEKENQKLYENIETINQSNIFSNEIMASTAALLADERDNDQTMEWISQVDNCEKKIPSSPVIGRQPTARKRSKRKSLQHSIKQKLKPLINSDISVNVNDESIQSNNTSEKQLISLQEINIKPNIDLLIDNVTDILQKRLEAISEQEKIIKGKKLNRPKAIKGKLLSYKEENHNIRLSWKKLVGDDVPSLCTYKELIDRDISSEILTITSTTASSFKFRCIDFYGEEIIYNNLSGLEMEDGCFLIPDKDNCIGISEIKRSFLASPGVDPSLIPRDWIENHYKWIIWKLASMDRIKFNYINIPRSLTPANVMVQLKYRYDREIDRLQRPCLRRILEKDDCASKRMVLCVSSITESRNDAIIETSQIALNINHWKMILTDGWYSIPAFIDTTMMNYITSGKIREGTKLMIFGAELLNLDQGCSPLEIPGDVFLRIHTNSTRRTKWDTKLGYTRCPGPMLIKLKNVCPSGGLIGKLKVMITRTYPMLYHEKNPSGESIFRNSRCEEKANLAFEEQYRLKVEAFYAEAEQKFDSARNDNFDSDDIDLNGQEKKMINQSRVVEEFKQELESKFRENMPPPRQVSSVLKVRINEENASAILTIWTPSEDIIDIFKEGTRISIHNVIASGKRFGNLQLTASRSTMFKKEEICKDFQSRIYTPLRSITDHSFNPLYGEFDTVGVVSSIINCPYGMKNFDAVNIACPSSHEDPQKNDTLGSSYLSILFWQGVSTFGYTEILTIGSLVACSNLEWRCATSWSIPIAYCTEKSVFTRNPRHNHLCQAFENIKDLIKIPYVSYAAKCAEDISLEIQKKTNLRTSLYITPDKNSPRKETLNTNNISISIGSNSSLDTRNSNSIRSAALQRRLEKLHYYSNPPELSPIVLKNASSRVSLDFRSPVRNNNLKPTKLNVDP